MQVFHGNSQVVDSLKRATVFTLGNFDGVHLGHQHLLAEVIKKSKEFNALAGVITFDPHPIKVLYPEKGLKEIFHLEDVLVRLADVGLDFTLVQKFDFEFSRLSPRAFVERLLPLKPEHIVIGYDFNFGADRAGHRTHLEEFGREFGFSVSQVTPLIVDGETVSSSRIRACLAVGEIAKANALLGGKPFALRGLVIKGHARGRRLGFPTANIATDAEIIPRTGVYITRVLVGGKSYESVTNVGYNPTFVDSAMTQKLSIETHICNFDLDIYGQKISLEFLSRLRDEMKFSSVADLVTQIKLDVQKAVEFFKAGNRATLG